jgi:hypothetical protein
MRTFLVFASLTATAAILPSALAQAEAPPEDRPFQAGAPLDLSPNVTVYGSFRFSESCTFDETRDLIIAMNRGMAQNQVPNDGYVSLINPDGSVHTLKWIGATRDGLTLNAPLGSYIHQGMLYAADRDGGTEEDPDVVTVIRWFDLASGEPAGEVRVEDSTGPNDLVVLDGTIYFTQTGSPDGTNPWRVFRVTPDGDAMILVDGEPLNRPNGINVDADGNLVVVNIGNDEVLTFSIDGELLSTEHTVDGGNDGIVIMADGTKYVSSVVNGTISVIRPGEEAELVASGIPSAASMCYDPVRNRLVVPMNNGNALAFVDLD